MELRWYSPFILKWDPGLIEEDNRDQVILSLNFLKNVCIESQLMTMTSSIQQLENLLNRITSGEKLKGLNILSVVQSIPNYFENIEQQYFAQILSYLKIQYPNKDYYYFSLADMLKFARMSINSGPLYDILKNHIENEFQDFYRHMHRNDKDRILNTLLLRGDFANLAFQKLLAETRYSQNFFSPQPITDKEVSVFDVLNFCRDNKISEKLFLQYFELIPHDNKDFLKAMERKYYSEYFDTFTSVGQKTIQERLPANNGVKSCQSSSQSEQDD